MQLTITSPALHREHIEQLNIELSSEDQLTMIDGRQHLLIKRCTVQGDMRKYMVPLDSDRVR